MATLFSVVLIGLTATAIMTLFLWIVHGTQFAYADMVRAIGSLFTRTKEGSLRAGLIVHFVSGVLFALLYIALWSVFDFIHTPSDYLVLGLLAGATQGVAVSVALVVLVTENHPLARFRRAGFRVPLTYLVAHALFGICVGLGAGLVSPRFQVVHDVVKSVHQTPGG